MPMNTPPLEWRFSLFSQTRGATQASMAARSRRGERTRRARSAACPSSTGPNRVRTSRSHARGRAPVQSRRTSRFRPSRDRDFEFPLPARRCAAPRLGRGVTTPSSSATPCRAARTAAGASPRTVATYVRSTSPARMRERVRGVAVGGQQQHAFGEVVEPAHVGEPGHSAARDRTPCAALPDRSSSSSRPAGLWSTSHVASRGAATGLPSTAIRSTPGSTLCPMRAELAVHASRGRRRPAPRPCGATRRRRAPARAGCASPSLIHHRRAARGRAGATASSSARGSSSQMAEGELLEEERRRAVQQRTPEPFGAPDHIDQPALVQRLEHAAHVDAADLLDLGAADRLAVGDDRERLERGGRQALRRAASCARSIASVYSGRVRICQPPPSSTSSTPCPSTS